MPAAIPTLLVVPSGIGCAMGGFAGDAIPLARLFSAVSGCLITHPNVLNGASLYWNDSRIQYVEGYALDRFVTGSIALRPVRRQKVGILLDKGIENELRQRHLQLANSCRATLGLDIGPVVTTELPLNVKLNLGSSGASWGGVSEPEALLKAGRLLKDKGATAIAVVTRFPDEDEEEHVIAYRKGVGVDPLAGAEAVVSHLLVRDLNLPCAHAPALSSLPFNAQLSPLVAAEEIGHTFLACVLVGLSRAPDLIPLSNNLPEIKCNSASLIKSDDIGAVIAPEGALGGEAVLSSIEKGIPLIIVENQNLMDITSKSLDLDHYFADKDHIHFMRANNYLEAAGLLMLLREGINPDSFIRPFPFIDELSF